MEEVMGRNPEVIVDMGEMAQTVGVTDAQKKAVVTLWRQYPMLEAVKRGRVFAVASDIYVVPGPRVAEAAREFARMFYSKTNP
jgi:iron complex transport system substrate-binding protein